MLSLLKGGRREAGNRQTWRESNEAMIDEEKWRKTGITERRKTHFAGQSTDHDKGWLRPGVL